MNYTMRTKKAATIPEPQIVADWHGQSWQLSARWEPVQLAMLLSFVPAGVPDSAPFMPEPAPPWPA